MEDLAKAHRELERKLGSQKQEWEAERLSRRPKTPAEYALSAAKSAPRDLVILDKPPGADFKPEDGKRYFVVNPDDPLLQLARKHAHAAGLDQDGFASLFTDFVELQIASEARQTKIIEDGRAAAMKALGENAQARIDQVARLVEKAAGADAVKALDIAYLPAPAIEALERLVEVQGGAQPFPNSAPGGGVEAMTQADITKLMASENYWKSGSAEQQTVTRWFEFQARQKKPAA